MIWFTVIFIYVLIGILSYYKVFSKWKDDTKFEQIWFSADGLLLFHYISFTITIIKSNSF